MFCRMYILILVPPIFFLFTRNPMIFKESYDDTTSKIIRFIYLF